LAQKSNRDDAYVHYKKSLIFNELELYQEALTSLDLAIQKGRNQKNDKAEKDKYTKKIKELKKEVKSKSLFKKIDYFSKYIQLADYQNALTKLNETETDVTCKIWCYLNTNKEQCLEYLLAIEDTYNQEIWYGYVKKLCQEIE